MKKIFNVLLLMLTISMLAFGSEGKKLPFHNKKILVVGSTQVDWLTSLGIAPQGYIGINDNDFPSYTKDTLKASGTKFLGDRNMLDPEVIMNFKPDLIIAGGPHKSYSMFEGENDGVDTFYINTPRGTNLFTDTSLKDILTKVAKKLELDGNLVNDVMAKYYNNYNAKANDIKKAMNGENILVLRIRNNEFRYYGLRMHHLLYNKEKLGLSTPKSFPTNKTYESISLETLLNINPDHLVILNHHQGTFDALASSGIFKALKAVKNNKVYVTDGFGVWFTGLGAAHTKAKMDEFYKMVVDKKWDNSKGSKRDYNPAS